MLAPIRRVGKTLTVALIAVVGFMLASCASKEHVALVDDPGQRLRLGAGARRRVQEIGLWESKFERVAELYDELAAPAQPPG